MTETGKLPERVFELRRQLESGRNMGFIRNQLWNHLNREAARKNSIFHEVEV
jgi:hypothetical protein